MCHNCFKGKLARNPVLAPCLALARASLLPPHPKSMHPLHPGLAPHSEVCKKPSE